MTLTDRDCADRSARSVKPDHARILDLIARHRSAKANGDGHAAEVALLDAQRALEERLAAMRQASR